MHNTYVSIKADLACRSILIVELVVVDENNYFQCGYCGDASSVSPSDRKATASWPCRNSIWRSTFGSLHFLPRRLEPPRAISRTENSASGGGPVWVPSPFNN